MKMAMEVKVKKQGVTLGHLYSLEEQWGFRNVLHDVFCQLFATLFRTSL